jgi:glycerol-3-phosphate acyltransferase PlsY
VYNSHCENKGVLALVIKIGLLILSYLLGSFPSALVIGKWVKGIDIREHGSKNMGSTNAGRVLGKKWGIVVFVLDALKGFIVLSLFTIFHVLDPVEHALFTPLVYGIGAILGHVFPIFAKFRGGKAVATSAGVVLAYNPLFFVIVIGVFLLVVRLSKYVSLASLIAVFVALLLAIFWKIEAIDYYFLGAALLINILIIIRHKENIKRIQENTERKINW